MVYKELKVFVFTATDDKGLSYPVFSPSSLTRSSPDYLFKVRYRYVRKSRVDVIFHIALVKDLVLNKVVPFNTLTFTNTAFYSVKDVDNALNLLGLPLYSPSAHAVISYIRDNILTLIKK
ncbi:hypothetical protein [Dipodfec virus RodF1_12]|uniref:Uncharacterized protein n=1 Tax=Dipodfec virus RodF1_12 TaxID=2929289 RepID=A0A976R5L0_9VIRU|nr:hypothetical protein [Dipodfec virus RodF1_12]